MPTPDLTAGTHDLRTRAGRDAAALDVARVLLPGMRPEPLHAVVNYTHIGGWSLLVQLADGTWEQPRPLPMVALRPTWSHKLPDGSLHAYALALASAWEAVCGARRGAA